MLRGLIAFCLLRRPLVLAAYVAFLGLGFVAFNALNIEAYPDPAPPIIEIIAQRPGQSPEEMERYVTIPIEIAVASTPGLRYLRSNTGGKKITIFRKKNPAASANGDRVPALCTKGGHRGAAKETFSAVPVFLIPSLRAFQSGRPRSF
jgi:AcrB/AcrD/AcrF family protein